MRCGRRPCCGGSGGSTGKHVRGTCGREGLPTQGLLTNNCIISGGPHPRVMAGLGPIGIRISPGLGNILPLPLREGLGGGVPGRKKLRCDPGTDPSPQPPPSRGGGGFSRAKPGHDTEGGVATDRSTCFATGPYSIDRKIHSPTARMVMPVHIGIHDLPSRSDRSFGCRATGLRPRRCSRTGLRPNSGARHDLAAASVDQSCGRLVLRRRQLRPVDGHRHA